MPRDPGTAGPSLTRHRSRGCPPLCSRPSCSCPARVVAWCPGPGCANDCTSGLAAKLMLVSAPAGFGKTTLLVDWMAAVSAPPTAQTATAWLSLDAGDNDPATFWTYVIAALRTVAPGIGADALGLLQEPQPPPIQVVLTTLLNDLGAVDGDVVLLLDDYHVIDSPEVHGGHGVPARPPPARLHLVIASRADPALPLPRLRARGDLVEIRAADLRFTPDEAAVLPQRRHGAAAHPGRRDRSGGAHRGLDRRAPARRALDGRTGRRRLVHRRLRGRRPLRRRLPGRGGPATSAGGRPDVPAADLRARPDDRLPVRRPHRAGRRPGRAGGTRPGQPVPGPAGRPPPVVPLPPPVRRRPAGPAPRRAARPHRRPAPAGQRAGTSRTATGPRRSGTRWPAATSRARPP